jgi:hypothetical protein
VSHATPDEERFSRAGAAVAGLFLALPFAALGGATVLAPSLALAGLIAAPWRRLHKAARIAGLPLYIAAAFLAWMGASVLWAPAGADRRGAAALAAFAAGALLLIVAAGMTRREDRRLAQRAGVIGVFLVIVFALIDMRFDFPIGRQLAPPVARTVIVTTAPDRAPITPAGLAGQGDEVADAPVLVKTRHGEAPLFNPDNARLALIGLVLIWGVCAMLSRLGWAGWVAMAALAGGAGWLCAFYGAGLFTAAALFGLGAALLALVWPRATVSILAQSVAGALVIAPLVLPQIADLSAQAITQFTPWKAPFGWLQRAEIWAFTAEKIQHSLFWGWGFGASAQFTDTYRLSGFTEAYIPRHPNSAPLQIWLETGAVGALLAAGALASFGRRAGAALADDRWAAAAAAGLLGTAAVIANVNGGTWALWWWGAIAASAALVRAAKRPG